MPRISWVNVYFMRATNSCKVITDMDFSGMCSIVLSLISKWHIAKFSVILEYEWDAVLDFLYIFFKEISEHYWNGAWQLAPYLIIVFETYFQCDSYRMINDENKLVGILEKRFRLLSKMSTTFWSHCVYHSKNTVLRIQTLPDVGSGSLRQ